MTNIVLIGMRGSGKTSLGKRIAKTMKRKFIDTDREIEKQERMPISKIVNRKGWNHFRKIEKYVIRRVSKEKDAIISTGGGAIIDTENSKQLKKNGFIVYLKAPVSLLAARLTLAPGDRPSLTDQHLIDELAPVLEKREPIYEQNADLIFEINDNPELDDKKDIKEKGRSILDALAKANTEFEKPE